MATLTQVLAQLKKKGDPARVKAFAPHGGPQDMYGVSVADLKGIAKGIRGEQELAYELYDSGNADAMYLAGMVADGASMTKARLDSWAKKAPWAMVAEYTVPGVAAHNRHGRDLALKWMRSKNESIASTGWCTYAGLVAITPDDALDLEEIEGLLDTVERGIDAAPNRVRYTMNGFVIAVGTYVKPLSKRAKATARKLGEVEVDMNGTTCKVPSATEKIGKVEKLGRVGKKRRQVKC